MTISLLGRELANWTGGIDFLRLCMAGLAGRHPEVRVNLLLAQPTLAGRIRSHLGGVKHAVRQLTAGNSGFTRIHRPTDQDLRDALQGTVANPEIIRYRDSHQELRRTLDKFQSSAVFPAMYTLGPDFPIPWVGYIADFQHRHLPHFFSQRDRDLRDRAFGNIIRDAKALSLNSRAVADDVRRFYPSSTCQLFVLPFAPMPAPEWLEPEALNVSAKYNLPRRFFLISNQFWVHKSHSTAFEALAALRQRPGFGDVELVCTGVTYDHRFPRHFAELKRRIDLLGISSSVHFLGKIPKLEQIHIMKRAVAVVQPTLFEGGPGGGSVYDAVAVGTRVIASDIPVNLEINNPSVRFFEAGSSESLRESLQEALQTPCQRPGTEELSEQGRAAKQSFGNGILSVVEYVITQKASMSKQHIARA